MRTRFHFLPIDEQMNLQSLAEKCFSHGKVVTVLFVDREPGSEVSIRINKKFDVSCTSTGFDI
jgi:hypothetical protein